ncbi:MAG: hypothetical protein ACBZ72_06145 [Candidatus Bathyarchaeia archaeon]
MAPQVSGATVDAVCAFSYTYQSNLTSLPDNSYALTDFTDASPTIIVLQGTNGTADFAEWVAYPQVPLDFGADFSRSETNLYIYPVTIDGALCMLTLRFGDVVK